MSLIEKGNKVFVLFTDDTKVGATVEHAPDAPGASWGLILDDGKAVDLNPYCSSLVWIEKVAEDADDRP